jgi:two-component system chemotaxis response regulator CheB
MPRRGRQKIKMVVAGTSMGGFQALKQIFSPLPSDFPVPVLVVRHQASDTDHYVIDAMNRESQLRFKFAEEGEWPLAGTVYLAPPDSHMMVHSSGQIHLSSGQPVNYSRPSIDPLFISAAQLYGESLLAMVLTGANSDGVEGVKRVKQLGGRVLVQDPGSAEADTLPRAALAAIEADFLIWLDQIGPFLWGINR